jgi:hypothetical protein
MIITSEAQKNSNRIYKAGGKLGYETMCYSGNEQCNNFFSKKSKKLILKTTHSNTYDMDGRFIQKNVVSLEDLVKTIKWYDSNNLRFELILSKIDSVEYLVLANTLQKYNVKMVPIQQIKEKIPFLNLVQLRSFVHLPSKNMLLIVNDSTKDIFTINVRANNFNEMKYHQLDFSYRVEKELSKEHNALVLWNNSY